MKKPDYETELDQLATTYETALAADVEDIKAAIAGASDSSVIGIGSGGSFTVASLLCNLHEFYTGQVSRPSTPLEIICNPTIAASSPVFLVSAEGRNPDIVEALRRARLHSARTVHILTNRESSPLIEHTRTWPDVTPHIFPLAIKDGYLATNSLLLDALLVARAYGELDSGEQQLPTSLTALRIGTTTVDEWLESSNDFVEACADRRSIFLLFSPLLRAVASDLESKLSEAALFNCQLADLRSFAHGRHLWLSERPEECAIVALIEPSLASLWDATLALIPPAIPSLTMRLSGAAPADLVAGLVAQMKLVAKLARRAGRDLASPAVQQFGRDLHYLALEELILRPATAPENESAVDSKLSVLGARWPFLGRRAAVDRARASFERDLRDQPFGAIVLDYDGTLSSSHRTSEPPTAQIVDHLERLTAGGVRIGIASGRGDSIREQLRESLSEATWDSVYLGLYNCGLICSLAEDLPASNETSEFLSHVRRIIGKLKSLGVPIKRIRTNHPYQVSVRFFDGVDVRESWFAIADSLRQAGLDVSRVVFSKHSVDVIAAGLSKSHLVSHLIDRYGMHPYEILTIGDQGAWPGNDSFLLEHRYSVSVDSPSRRLDRGWKLAPAHTRDVEATLWYLERLELSSKRTCRFDFADAASLATQ